MTEAIFIVGLVIVSVLAGFSIGNAVGQDRACKSVKMEWVKGKCMKVTREEVK